MDPAPEPDQDNSSSSFDLICPGCGADVNAPDREFEMGEPALVPHADFMLSEVRCLSCGTSIDLCLWLVSKEAFMKDAATQSSGVDTLSPGGVAILDRYLRMVEERREEWERFCRLEEELPEIDLSAVDLGLWSGKCPATPARVLAATRGLRKAVAAHPGEACPGMLRIGQFNCLLSLDEHREGGYTWALHLSVNNTVSPGMLSALEEAFLTSLFFIPSERPFLWREPGQTIPVMHYYLGADSPELNEC